METASGFSARACDAVVRSDGFEFVRTNDHGSAARPMRRAGSAAHTSFMLLRGTPGAARVLALPVALVVLALGAVGAWSTVAGDRRLGVVAFSALLFGLLQLGRALYGLFERRRRADSWLRSASGTVVPRAYAWRAAQLTALRNRRMLARTLRLVAATAEGRPVGRNRPRLIAARRRRISLEALAKRLERADEPVTPAGMLRVTELITAGSGPLWGTSEEALGEAIETTLAVLAPPSHPGMDACAA